MKIYSDLLLLTFLFFINSYCFGQVLNPCARLTPIHVVVIGSSTAAGSGPSSSDSTWVNRYRKHLQEINPANQVTNLAVGGTTTYHIMPDWFVTPTGKPAITPAKNVTMALSLNPDAIIVNMPSNDGANGFGVNEQMSNFITLYNEADTAGVQMWVCTTQPKNTNAAKKTIQTEVRDSISNYFGAYAIDFWTTIANSTDGIDTLYDSGDGTHLNNAGHRILYNRVLAKGILNEVTDTLSFTDNLLQDIYLDHYSLCGDSSTKVNAVVANVGFNNSSSFFLVFERTNTGSTIPSTSFVLVSAINSCSSDTVSFIVNTYNAVDFSIKSYLISSDSIKTNDTSSSVHVITNGHPTISIQNDTVCSGYSGFLLASGNSINDTVFWYDSLIGGNIVGYGDSLNVMSVLNSKTFYPEVVRGDLYYKESLFTSDNATIHWNGMMFNVVANDTLVIDSLAVNIQTPGAQTIVGLYRMESYLGHETSSAGWNNWGTQNLTVDSGGDFKTINLSTITLNPNDTLGIYLYMQNSASRLSYLSSANGGNITNSKIKILSGSGISHTYGTSYTPRYFSGEVFYHYGFRPQGDCVSTRKPVELVVSQPIYQFGNDTSLAIYQSITLGVSPVAGNTYLWSNSATTAQIIVDSVNFSLGTNTIWLQTTDKFGCVFMDTIVVSFYNNVSLGENNLNSIQIFPNPTKGIINLSGVKEKSLITISSITGKIIYESLYAKNSINLSDFSKGVYFLTISQNKNRIIKKLILD